MVENGRAAALGAELKRVARGMVIEGEPLAKRTAFGVGGPADLMYLPESVDDLMSTLPLIKDAEVPILPIGGGTNMLVKDAGFRGVVIGLTEGMTGIVIQPRARHDLLRSQKTPPDDGDLLQLEQVASLET